MSITFSGVRLSGNIVLPHGSGGGATEKFNGFGSWNNVLSGQFLARGGAYDSNKLLMIGSGSIGGGYIASTDGTTWGSPTVIDSNINFQSSTYSGNQFIALGYNVNYQFTAYRSTDGATWSSSGNGSYTWKPDRVVYGNGHYIATGYGVGNPANNYFPMYATSSDGATWTENRLGAKYQLPYDIAYGNGMFIAVGTNGAGQSVAWVTSNNGSTWSGPTAIAPTSEATTIAYGNGVWVAFVRNYSAGSCQYITSTDGATWSSPTTLSSSALMNTVRYVNGNFVATGTTNTGDTARTDVQGTVMYSSSSDGTTWTTPVAVTGASSTYIPMDLTHAFGKWQVIGYNNANYNPGYAISA